MVDNALRIGITMRTADAAGYDEPRDALARNWGRYLNAALPDAAWMPIPNLGPSAVEHCRRWNIDALILSGGEDIGAVPARDSTEDALLRHFIAAGQPVFGVCRGAQMIWRHFHGQLAPVIGHIAVRHALTPATPGKAMPLFAGSADVNSYHAIGLTGEPPADLEALATAADGSIEAIRHRRLPLLGVMWHPERDWPAATGDFAMIRHLFGSGKEAS